MVFIQDEGSLFDAPIEVVWEYFLGGKGHGDAHANVRNGAIESNSKTSFVLSTERKKKGRWRKESVRVTPFPPLGAGFVMLRGAHARSKMFIVYSPAGNKTRIDVYGDFVSRTTPADRLEREVLDGLKTEFDDDAPVVKALARSKDASETPSTPSSSVRIRDQRSVFQAPIGVLWKYLVDGNAHDGVHSSTRNGSFQGLSENSFIYSSERNLNGRWSKEKIRITVYQPLGFAFEWLDGLLNGSKMFYIYVPQGDRTRIDVHAEFMSNSIPPDRLQQTVRNMLDREFKEDAPAIKTFAGKV
jgi:hypothetical protein